MVEKLNNILTEGSKHKKHVSDQAVWVMPDSGNNRASWGNGGVWFPMAGRKEIKILDILLDVIHMRADHTHFKCSSNSQSSDLRGKKKIQIQ